MGIKVAATLDSEFKFNYTLSTVLAPAFTIDDDDLAIWIGNAHGMSKSEELEALTNCSNVIRENATETPTGDNESYAETSNVMQKDVNSAFNSAIDTLLTGTVTVGAGTKAVTGVATTFLTDLSAADVVLIEGEYHVVDAITTNLALTIVDNHVGGAAAADYSLVTLTALSGTMSVTAGTDDVVGVGTDFVTELVAGTSVLLLEDEYIGVTTITDLENIILASNHVGGAAAATGQLATPTLLTGTVSVGAGTAAVVGVGTTFTDDLAAGDSIKIASAIHTVLTIVSNLSLTLATNHVAGASGVAYSLVAVPEEGKVGIWYGPDFQNITGGTITPFVIQLMEAYVEQSQA